MAIKDRMLLHEERGLTRMMELRACLVDMGISWWDETDTEMRLARTKFEYGGRKHSVIYGPYSWGYEQGLLEYWDYNNKEPEGGLTVEEIIERIKAI